MWRVRKLVGLCPQGFLCSSCCFEGEKRLKKKGVTERCVNGPCVTRVFVSNVSSVDGFQFKKPISIWRGSSLMFLVLPLLTYCHNCWQIFATNHRGFPHVCLPSFRMSVPVKIERNNFLSTHHYVFSRNSYMLRNIVIANNFLLYYEGLMIGTWSDLT